MDPRPHDMRSAVVLLAEDNPAEQQLARRALERGVIPIDLRVVSDGEEALDYLHQTGEYTDPQTSPRPALILLDLNMPKLDGRQVLEDIKADPQLRNIPVVVLTTSQHEQDVFRSYQLGCNSFITKPVEVHDFVEAVRELGSYWLRLVVLPPDQGVA